MLEVANIFFHVCHIGLILFTLTGWIFRKTRRAHLFTVFIIFASWFGLGIFFGWGYCPLTDWHWHILYQQGHTLLPASYIQFLAESILGTAFQPVVIDIVTLFCLFAAFALSLKHNFFSAPRSV